MRKKTTRPPIKDVGIAQRGIVIQLVSDEHAEQWTLAELERTLFDVEPGTLRDALATLEREEVAQRSGERVAASRCARHLDALGMVCI